MKVKVIGAGLAGCEAVWQLVKQGIDVDLYEMKPVISFISSANPSEVSGPVAIIVYSSGLISVTSSLNTVTRG